MICSSFSYRFHLVLKLMHVRTMYSPKQIFIRFLINLTTSNYGCNDTTFYQTNTIPVLADTEYQCRYFYHTKKLR